MTCGLSSRTCRKAAFLADFVVENRLFRCPALAARDEAELRAIEVQLRRHGIAHRAIREPDPPYCGALMAIGIEPVVDRRVLKKVTGSLPLLR